MPNDDIRFLFRFRDLIAHTVEEHAKILRERQRVWWGWWKRPSEDARQPVWNALDDEIKAHGAATIGLFHSGTGQVFSARVCRVIPPPAGGSLGAVPLAAEELELVPAYYRSSPFSRAWMLLERLDETPINFFGAFSITEPPPLPQYGPDTLRQFADKVIEDPDELRGMDTTIWTVRPKRDGDRQGKILLTTGAVSSPISRHPIPLQSNVILHITDLHFATGSNRARHRWRLESETGDGSPTLADAIATALTMREKRTVGAIIATGDFTYIADATEFSEATAAIGKLAGALNLAPDHFVIVPGNHDIKWARADSYKEDAQVTIAPTEAKKDYATFYEQTFRHRPNLNLSMGRRFLLPNGVLLDVCALNSSSLATGKHFLAGMGRIEEHAFEDVAKEMGWVDERSLALRLLAIHHHLVLTENFEPSEGYYKGFGIAVDAPRIQRKAAALGFHLALHGHKHRAFLWRSGVYNLPEAAEQRYRLGDLAIVGGGSAGSTEVEAESNFFNTLTFNTSNVEMTIYRSKNGGSFTPIQTWNARLGLQSDTGRLSLDEWKLQKLDG